MIKRPSKIAVKKTTVLNSIVPGHVWQQAPFTWQPTIFIPNSPGLTDEPIDPVVQENSLKRFMTDPLNPGVYCVTGNPNDKKAKYFAAFLVSLHMAALRSHRVAWEPLYGGFKNRLMDADGDGADAPTMIVLTNLAPNSTNVKFEKAKDIIERFQTIPIVVVGSGCDPYTLMCANLYAPFSGAAYFPENIVKSVVEV